MKNNQAFVAYLKNITPITGADKIVQADVVLNGVKITQVVVGVGTKEDTKIVYFDSNLCLSQKILEDYPDLGRYLSKAGRVKTVRLRGVISNGLAVTADHFQKYEPLCVLDEGFSFNELGGVEICKKYAPPARGGSMSSGGKKGKKPKVSRMLEGQFHFHVDTDQLLRNTHKLSPTQVISISRKIHGTSAIASNCLVKRPKTLIERLKFWDKTDKTHYDMVYASRSVIKNDALTAGFYGFDLWADAGKLFFAGKMATGETVYYEIVGFTPTGGGIQKGYDYGCEPNTYKIAIYRITKTGLDGHVTEYGWQAMKDRCREWNLPHVEEYYFGQAGSLFELDRYADDWSKQFVAALKVSYLEKYCTDCVGKIPDEGIVLRIEGLNINVYKLKSEMFLLGESKAAEEGAEDLEENQGSDEKDV